VNASITSMFAPDAMARNRPSGLKPKTLPDDA
jgi:hypothetical protein